MTDTPTTELAPELRDDVTRVRDQMVEARSLLEALSPAQLAWSPGPGRWSAGEVVAHMHLSNEGYLVNFEEPMRRGRERGWHSDGPFRYGWFERWFVGLLEPPYKRAIKAPRRFRPESSTPVPPDIVARFLDGLERFEATMIAANGLDLARIKVTSPVTNLLRFRLGAAFRILLAHNARHLLQVKNTRAVPGFPETGESS